jgi:hypothetical protein
VSKHNRERRAKPTSPAFVKVGKIGFATVRDEQGRLPRYITKLQRMYESGQLDLTVQGVDFYHDDHCGVFEGLMCDCDPDVRVRSRVGEN